MNWLYYPYFFVLTAAVWMAAFLLLFSNRQKSAQTGLWLSIAGTLAISVFTAMLWIKLERPPMRTLGETRLWYSLFLPVIGIITYMKWKYRWFLQYSLGLAMVFLIINYTLPETHDKTLMPALQSVWFVPHVVVYIFAYALLAASSLTAVKGIFLEKTGKFETAVIDLADNFVYIGFAFLTLGLLFGALWAKEAWGDYWTWDPKESWALLTWLCYLVYIHLRYHKPKQYTPALWIMALSFVILLICWFGVNYLPTAQNSVHTYTN